MKKRSYGFLKKDSNSQNINELLKVFHDNVTSIESVENI